MWPKKLREKGYIASLLVLVFSIATAAVLFFNRQLIVDQLSVWQYQPSEEVVSLVSRTTMNETGTFYFYTSHPAIETAERFNKECTSKEEGTAVLGCYDGRRIFIYNVTDARLDGIREVTAAHEMLHAVYDRLSQEEKDKVGILLEAEYEEIKNDQKFAERMSFYARTEPGERLNELHSIIGTEVGMLAPELEAYYKKYFDERSKVVALYEKYASVFLSLQKRSDEISAQLTNLGSQIEAESVSYNTAIAQLNQDIAAFNAKSTSGEFSSQAQFQSERSVLLARARQLDVRRNTINSLTAQYNQLRDELGNIASQSEALNQSINSNLAPAPSI